MAAITASFVELECALNWGHLIVEFRKYITHLEVGDVPCTGVQREPRILPFR
jgi:hypothetical protein